MAYYFDHFQYQGNPKQYRHNEALDCVDVEHPSTIKEALKSLFRSMERGVLLVSVSVFAVIDAFSLAKIMDEENIMLEICKSLMHIHDQQLMI